MRIAVGIAMLALAAGAARAEEPRVLAAPAAQMPHDLIVDGAYVYWTDRAGGAVWRVPVRGGDAAQIAAHLAEPRWLAAAGGAVFVTTNDGVIRIDPARGKTHVVLDGVESDTSRLAADRHALFVAHGGKLDRFALPSLRRAELTDDAGDVLAMVVDGKDVVYTTSGDHSVWRTTGDGSLTKRLATLDDDAGVLAIDATTIYVPVHDDLLAIPRAGGTPTVAIAKVGEVDALIADRGTLYWASVPAGTISSASTSERVEHVRYADQARAFALAADAGALYWFTATLGGGPTQIVRAPR